MPQALWNRASDRQRDMQEADAVLVAAELRRLVAPPARRRETPRDLRAVKDRERLLVVIAENADPLQLHPLGRYIRELQLVD